MPEGDTIHRAARRLAGAAQGQRVETVRCARAVLKAAQLEGRRLSEVRALGKHLLFVFEGGLVLHTHMGMHGSWRVYRRGQRWNRPRHRAAIALEMEHDELVCFDPSLIELMPERELAVHPRLSRLGPDLLGPALSVPDAVARLVQYAALPVGQALLDQRAVAGIGNVIKSETLFLCGIHPERRVSDLAPEQLTELVETARRLLRRGTARGPRVSRLASDGPKLWVYKRSGERCLRCGELVQMVRQGAQARSSYFCPSCQPAQGQAAPQFEHTPRLP